MKTYIATIVSAQNLGPATSIRVRIADGRELDLRASTRVAIEAITLIGRRVRFQVQLSEATECLTAPLLVVGSEYGLKALPCLDGGAGAGFTVGTMTRWVHEWTDFDLTKLPKALSEDERRWLAQPAHPDRAMGARALALIDALTAALAESVARMTVAEQKAQVPWTNGQAVDHMPCLQMAQNMLDRATSAESERDAALARAEAAEKSAAGSADGYFCVKGLLEAQDRMAKGYRKQIAVLESEAAALRTEETALMVELGKAYNLTEAAEKDAAEVYDRLMAAHDRAESEAAALRAEIAAYEANLVDTEALRAENERLLRGVDIRREAHDITAAQLAAANALLERAAARLDRVNFPLWWEAYDAHLAGQPAAPTRAPCKYRGNKPECPYCKQPAAPSVGCDYPASWCSDPACQKCKPTPCDTCEDAGLQLCPCPTRAAAEQRVLDACAAIPHRTITTWKASPQIRAVCQAELARRAATKGAK